MKATIDHAGLMTIEPETPPEAYALSRWSMEAGLLLDPLAASTFGKETFLWRGSKMLLSANCEKVGSPPPQP